MCEAHVAVSSWGISPLVSPKLQQVGTYYPVLLIMSPQLAIISSSLPCRGQLPSHDCHWTLKGPVGPTVLCVESSHLQMLNKNSDIFVKQCSPFLQSGPPHPGSHLQTLSVPHVPWGLQSSVVAQVPNSVSEIICFLTC